MHPKLKIWWSYSLHRFWLIHPCDRRTDRRTELRWLRRVKSSSCFRAEKLTSVVGAQYGLLLFAVLCEFFVGFARGWAYWKSRVAPWQQAGIRVSSSIDVASIVEKFSAAPTICECVTDGLRSMVSEWVNEESRSGCNSVHGHSGRRQSQVGTRRSAYVCVWIRFARSLRLLLAQETRTQKLGLFTVSLNALIISTINDARGRV